jgi:hypothetical protein
VINLEQFELEHWGPVLKFAAARFLYQAFPQLASSALEMTASGLGAPRTPRIFAQDLREISPSLNDDLLDLFGRSERTLSNQFTFQTQSDGFQEEIGWELHESPAWRTELHAFDFGLELALNYRISREERYARHLRYLIAHWICANPPGQGTGWSLNPLARRVRNWILSADLARDDWERDTIFFNMVAKSLMLQATYLLQHSASLRFTDDAVQAARALHLAGRFFGGREGAEISACARESLLNEINEHFTADGHYAESRPGSQLRLACTVVEFLALGVADGAVKAFLEEKLWAILKVVEGCLLPDGTLPAFGPAPASAGDDLTDLFALAAVLLDEPMWKDLAGKFGVFPYMLLGEMGKAHFDRLPEFPWEPARCLQPHCGISRLSITHESAMVINGRLPRTRNDHQDALSYELAIHGQRVIVDSGAFALGSEASADYFSSQQAHNVLMVDGKGPQCVKPAESIPPMDVQWDQEERTIGLSVAWPGFPFAGLTHQRAWFCLDGQAWVVLDGIKGSERHTLSSFVHFYPTFETEVKNNAAIVRSLSFVFTVFPIGPPGGKMYAARGDNTGLQGWYSPAPGMKYDCSVLKLEWEGPPLPWVGGYVIIPGAEVSFHAEDTDPVAGAVNFRIGDREYRLSMGPISNPPEHGHSD